MEDLFECYGEWFGFVVFGGFIVWGLQLLLDFYV